MKRFLTQIIYFTLTVVVLAFLFSGLNLYFIKKNILNPENFRLNDSTEILIIGDSHTALSLNPALIEKSENQAILGEHYLYSYSRLKYFLKNNPNLKYVVLSFNYSSIAKPFDEGLFEGRTQSFFFKKEFMLLGNEELNLLKTNNLVYIRNLLAWKFGVPSRENLSLLNKTFSKTFTKNQMPFRGRFLDCGDLSYVNDYQVKIRIKEFFEPDKEPAISNTALDYIEKIKTLCDSYGISLVLYASPLNNLFYEAIPEFYVKAFETESEKLSKSMIFMNYSRYQLPDSCFEDVNHLNGIGAKIISSRFLDDLHAH
jgi:hypothetical protein